MWKFLSIVMAALAVSIWYGLFYRPYQLQEPKTLLSHYDYIIVGSGTAGSVLAVRLSEDPKVTVLLLEAGGDHYDVPWSHVPTFGPMLQLTSIDWQFETAPQTNAALGFRNRQITWPRGKCLGGSSVLNFVLYARGNPASYDRWAELMNNSEWSFSELLPYFTKLEDMQVPSLKGTWLHSIGGPITVTETKYESKLAELFLLAVQEKGYRLNEYNGLHQDGFSRTQFTIKDGKRCSAANCYLEPALSRSNLHVVVNAHVTKVQFSEARRAVGVEYRHGGQMYSVQTNREIILSAGAIGSPQLLMLSGIGPKAMLNALGIPLTVDTPAVGQHLMDHPNVDIYFEIDRPLSLQTNDLFNPITIAKSLYQYLIKHDGPLAYPPIEITGFYRTGAFDNDLPDIQLLLLTTLPPMVIAKSLTEEVYNVTYGGLSGKYAFSVIISLQQPQSKGYVALKSNDALQPPLMQPNYLSNPMDVKALISGIKIAVEIITKSKVFQEFHPKVIPLNLPGCSSPSSIVTDDYWECYIRHKATTTCHPVGTARMGQTASDAVVDRHLHVFDTAGLRVVDASIFPEQIVGNPNVAITMIAEKAADMIKNDWKSEMG